MSKRPSSTFNDPGFFYSQRKLLRIFAITSGVLVLGMIMMIWQDFDRPWKDEQREEFKWEAARFALENMILQTMTVEDRAKLTTDRASARKVILAKQDELDAIREKLPNLQGLFYDADYDYKAQKQFTGQAEYRVNEAKNEADRAHWNKKLREERDKEHRLRDTMQLASETLNLWLKKEKDILTAIDDVVAAERANPKLQKMQILAAGIAKKRGYNPLREIPMFDFMAPPTKVEQIVLDNLVDNYEFSMPKKVDRCGTCHMGAMRQGFEREKWPIQILDKNYKKTDDPATKKGRVFDDAIYRFTFDLLASVWGAKVKADDPYVLEKSLMRDLEIHNVTLSFLFKEYDDEDGEIGTREVKDQDPRKVYRSWKRNEESGEWEESDDGTPFNHFYRHLLGKMRSQWLTHPHFSDMVGDASPHPYEKFGCTTCHQGRGWSVDFGFAFHSPDRKRIDNWMTNEWADEHGHHAPVNAKMSFTDAMQQGASKDDTVSVSWTVDHDAGHVWEQELGWTHEKTHHWSWPQHPMMLVQASCLKCHKEGLYRTPEQEYLGIRLGKPDPRVPDTLDWEDHAKSKSYELGPDKAGEYGGRIFIPEKEKAYRPENLERGMNGFLRFGCYGCHKVDPKVYPFMDNVRKRPAPPLDSIGSKTSRTFMQKWVRNPKAFRADTRMPRFFGLSNNPKHFTFRFADGGDKPVDGDAWTDAEVYAIVEWMLDESSKREQKFDAVDLSRGDAARGARIVAADVETTEGAAKACIACHEVPLPDALQYDKALVKEWSDKIARISGGWGARMSRRQGPKLDGIGSKVDANWLYAWLKQPRGYWHDTNMPNLRLTDQEALDVTAFLMTQKDEVFDKLPGVAHNDMIMLMIAQELKVSEQQESTGDATEKVKAWTPRERTLYVGKKLVKHYGCFGCHEIEAYKDTTPIGTELTEWGSKLIARLEFNHAPIDKTRFDFGYTKLINPRIYDLGMSREDRPLERLKMPRFGLTPEEARDIATFLVGMVNDPIPEKSLFLPDQRQSEIIRGREVVKRYNCQGCHMIEGEGGDVWAAVKGVNGRPPDLLGQGSKTNPAWLFKFMKDPAFVLEYSPAGEDRLRPWHSIRMPTFELSDEESRSVVRYFAALSRVPADFESAIEDGLKATGDGYPKTFELKDPNDAEGVKKIRRTVFSRLDETDAMFQEYACKSCHFPDPVTGKATAPNFRHTLNGRLRGVWIESWLWGPFKLQAGTQMPTFFGKEKAKAQDKRFFQVDPKNPDTDKAHAATSAEQVRALRDYIRYHYKDE